MLTINAPSPAMPRVSVIIPVYNQWPLTRACLASLAAHTPGVPFEIIIVDDGSHDETVQVLPSLSGLRFHRFETNQGFAKGVNQGARMARGEYLLFLNNDTEVQPGWLDPLVAVLDERPQVAAVGSKLLFPDGTIQHAGIYIGYGTPHPLTVFHADYGKPPEASTEERSLNAVTAACMLIRAQVFASLGGLDEGYRTGHEDIDLCFKIRAAGHQIIYTPKSVVVHHESKSTGRYDRAWRNLERLHEMWLGRFSAFDIDVRTLGQRAAVDPRRPGVSVIVPVCDSLGTIAACLENIRASLGPQDQLILVDNGSRGATRTFLQQFRAEPAACVHTRHDERVSLDRAVNAGLALATRPLAAIVGPNVRVPRLWLDRLVGHVQARPPGPPVAARLGNATGLSNSSLFVPGADPDPSQVVRCVPGQTVEQPLAVGCLLGATSTLAQGFAHPGMDSFATLSRQGAVATAPDVVAYRLGSVADARPEVTMANLVAQRRERRRTEFAPGEQSIVVLHRGDESVLQRCLDALATHSPPGAEVIVVNCDANTIIPGRNQGIAAAHGATVVLIESTTVVTSGWLARLRSPLIVDPRIAMVGPALNRPGAQNLNRFVHGDLEAFAAQHALEHEGELAVVPYLHGSCVLLDRAAFTQAGGFDARLESPEIADQDLALRLQQLQRLAALAWDAYVDAPNPRRSAEEQRAFERMQLVFQSRWGFAAS